MTRLGVFIAIVCSAACVAAPLPEHAVESMRVHEVVEAMQTAIERGDAGGYMAQINPSDSVLVTEHRAWFADLSFAPVDDLMIAIDPSES